MEWEYSRSWRAHYIDDGVYYSNSDTKHRQLWTIASSAPYGCYQNKYGYDLYHKGKFVKHGKTVKELKTYVAEQYFKANR